MSSDFFPTFWATLTFSHIMFFTEIFAIKCVNCSNDGLFTFGTFVRSPLIVFFTDWLSFVKEILTSQNFVANETFQTSRMVCLFARFNAIPLDWLFANTTLLNYFRVVLLAVRFTILLKEFSVNSPFTDTALKALFMVDLAKGCATIFFNYFHTYTTFSNCFFHNFGCSVANFGLNRGVIQVNIRFQAVCAVCAVFGAISGISAH